MKLFISILLLLPIRLLFGQEGAYICHQDHVLLTPLANLNSKSIEFSPAYYQQGIVYVVAREHNNFLDPKTGKAYFDLMYADVGPDGNAGKSINFSPNIRTQYHEGPCYITPDGKELFFTRSNLSGNQGINDDKGDVQLKIYHAVKGDEDWEQVTELPFCSDQYSVAHPALSADGNMMIFSSNMPGGLGGMDLYEVHREAGTWTSPVNLGAAVNTKGNEVFPFLHPEGYLVFSSDGLKGMGGLDLFVTSRNVEEVYSSPQHLDAPFNSGRDDLGLIINADGTSGFMGSDRKPTQGKDDLYRWVSDTTIFCKPVSRDHLTPRDILVLDEEGHPVERSQAWIIPMTQEGPTLFKDHFTADLVEKEDKAGAFAFQWRLIDSLPAASANSISDPSGKVMLNADDQATYIILASHEGYDDFVTVVNGDHIPGLITLKKSKTDKGPCVETLFTVYNDSGEQVLSGATIHFTGNCKDEVPVILTDDKGFATVCLPSNCAMKAEITKPEFATHAFTFTPTEAGEHWKIYLKKSNALAAPPSPIATGTVIVLDNIYYDFNKSVIRKGDAGELIALADIMKKYPDLTIELTSHTDTRGSAEYNMELSARRSESSKAYLVLLGIDANRIVTKAAGETSPRNKCVDGVPCSEQEHQYNRRTEVRIINPAQGMQIRYKEQ